MIINCSACSTRYLVDPHALGPTGRRVRCAKCGTTWHQNPSEHTPPGKKAAAPVAPEMPPEIPVVRPLTRRRPIPRGSNLPVVTGKRARSQLMSSMILVAVVAMIMGPGGYYFRDSIVKAWPPAGKLYATLNIPLGQEDKKPLETPAPVNSAPVLEFRNIKVTRAGNDGGGAMIVRGDIYNLGDGPATLPPMLGKILDDKQNLLYDWSFDPPAPDLAAHKVLAFETRVEEPPAAMTFVDVEFVHEK